MYTLKQFYEAVGSDVREVLDRLGGNEAFVMRFLRKFASDKSFEELQTSLDSGDVETAFRAAHTLKGVCANLGITRLFGQASEITELLRAGGLDDARLKFSEVEHEYKHVLEALEKLND